MITRFKIFENLNEGEPEIGDYVILNITELYKHNRHNINNLIGRIYEKNPDQIYPYKIQFEEIELNPAVYDFEIKYWSKNKEDLEIYLQSNKYNL